MKRIVQDGTYGFYTLRVFSAMCCGFFLCIPAFSFSRPETGGTEQMFPAGQDWILQNIRLEGEMTEVPDDIMLTLYADRSSVSGFSGCNEYKAEYTYYRKNLSITRIAATDRPCPPGRAASLEPNFFDCLAAAAASSMRDGQLVLFDSNGKELLVFRPFSPENTEWVLAEWNDRGTMENVSGTADGRPRLTFYEKDYAVSVPAAAAGITGDYTYDSFRSMKLTIRHNSAGTSGAVSVKQYEELLNTVSRYILCGDRLTMTNNRGTPLFVWISQ